MSDTICGYAGDREAALAAYLYGDFEEGERERFAEHLATCLVCRRELDGLGAVRGALRAWAPPEPASPTAVTVASPAVGDRRSWSWHSLPAWARTAAAIVVCGAALGAANLDIRSGSDGLVIRTGWIRPAPAATRDAQAGTRTSTARDVALAGPSTPGEPITRAETEAMIAELRTAVERARSADAAQLARLIADSERKQQNELALRSAALLRETNAQRQSDLARISANLNVLSREVLGQREINSSMMSLVRLSQR
jgi:hypothetical protein